jgi:hypothetical protein
MTITRRPDQEQAIRDAIRGEQQEVGGQGRKPLVLWNNDPIEPVLSCKKPFGIPADLQNGRVQPRFGLTLLTPDFLPLSPAKALIRFCPLGLPHPVTKSYPTTAL